MGSVTEDRTTVDNHDEGDAVRTQAVPDRFRTSARTSARRTVWWTAVVVVAVNLVAGLVAGETVPRHSTVERVADLSLPLTWVLGIVLLVIPRTTVLGLGVIRGGFLVVLLGLVLVPVALVFAR